MPILGAFNLRIQWYALTVAVMWSIQAIPQTDAPPAQRWADLEHCEISAAGGRLTSSARCGELEVAEDRDNPDGRRITLQYAVLPARSGNPQPDPVAFLAGGPGQSARDVLPLMDRALRDINLQRDLIFLDQRGTGGSNALDCDLAEADAWITPDWEEFEERIRDCLDEWDADVRHYTTADGADDLDALRRQFGIETLNLVGGSYGTRMAQVYLRRYPERVRSVILDGVVPTRLPLGSEHAEMLDRALDKVFAACAGDPACGEAFPALDQALADLRRTVTERDLELAVTDPRTGISRDLVFGHDALAGALRFLSYQPESQMLIPYLVHEAATTGDPTRLASQLLMIADDLEEQIALGLNFVVGCSEDWPAWPRGRDDSDTLLGDSMAELFERVCAWWPAGEVADDFHQPFDPGVPVLILSGEFDPVTPPAYGDEAAEQYANSLHLTATGRGHIVITNRCVGSIATEFMETTAVEDLDTDCLDALGPVPFFVDLLGPTP